MAKGFKNSLHADTQTAYISEQQSEMLKYGSVLPNQIFNGGSSSGAGNSGSGGAGRQI